MKKILGNVRYVMGISYAPFGGDEDSPSVVLPQKAPIRAPVVSRNVGPDSTECNHLILFFVLGVFLLSLLDGV